MRRGASCVCEGDVRENGLKGGRGGVGGRQQYVTLGELRSVSKFG